MWQITQVLVQSLCVAMTLWLASVAMGQDTDGDGLLDLIDAPGFDANASGTVSLGCLGIEDLDGANLLTQVDDLLLACNQITSIEGGDFAGLANLESLYLTENQITSLEGGDFAGLANLEVLYLAENQITSLESGAFRGPNNLEVLGLEYNQITTIESGAFDSLSNLEFLNLAGNPFTELNFSQAEFRDLGGNSGLSIDGDTITSLLLDDATLSNHSFDVIVSKTTSISDVSLVGLRFSDEVPGELSRLLSIGTLNNVTVDQALHSAYADELNAFADGDGNTLTLIGYGDANKDGEFNSSDLVDVFVAGKYEDGIDGNAYWTEGDWNSDGDFDSGDLVAAFGAGRYEQGPMAVVSAVPEPGTIIILMTGLLGVAIRRRHAAV